VARHTRENAAKLITQPSRAAFRAAPTFIKVGRMWSWSVSWEFCLEPWPRGAAICAQTSSCMRGATYGQAGWSSWSGG